MNDAPLGVGHSSEQAYDFYDSLTATLGIDGFETEWEDQDGGKPSRIVLALNSNQVKNVDNLNPTENPDIRYSKSIDEYYNDVQFDDTINPTRTLVAKDEFVEMQSEIFRIVQNKRHEHKSLRFSGVAYSYNHMFFFDNYNFKDYDLTLILDADSVKTNIHEVEKLEREEYENIINEIDEIDGVQGQADSRSSFLLDEGRSAESNDNISEESQGSNRGTGISYSVNDNQKFSKDTGNIEIDDNLLDDAMFESLFNDGFIDELEDELDDQKYVSKKYTGWLEELMDSLEESIKAAESGTKRERKKAQRHLLNDAPFGVGHSGPPLRLT